MVSGGEHDQPLARSCHSDVDRPPQLVESPARSAGATEDHRRKRRVPSRRPGESRGSPVRSLRPLCRSVRFWRVDDEEVLDASCTEPPPIRFPRAAVDIVSTPIDFGAVRLESARSISASAQVRPAHLPRIRTIRQPVTPVRNRCLARDRSPISAVLAVELTLLRSVQSAIDLGPRILAMQRPTMTSYQSARRRSISPFSSSRLSSASLASGIDE